MRALAPTIVSVEVIDVELMKSTCVVTNDDPSDLLYVLPTGLLRVKVKEYLFMDPHVIYQIMKL